MRWGLMRAHTAPVYSEKSCDVFVAICSSISYTNFGVRIYSTSVSKKKNRSAVSGPILFAQPLRLSSWIRWRRSSARLLSIRSDPVYHVTCGIHAGCSCSRQGDHGHDRVKSHFRLNERSCCATNNVSHDNPYLNRRPAYSLITPCDVRVSGSVYAPGTRTVTLTCCCSGTP